MLLPDIENTFDDIRSSFGSQGDKVVDVDFTSPDAVDIWDWSTAFPKLQHLESGWQDIWNAAKTNRKNRYYDFDVEALRKDGKLLQDETIFPRRVINTNMERGAAPYIQFVKNTRRTAIIRSTTDPNVQTELLERDFTRLMRYDGWELPQFKVLDSCMLHGWASIQTMFDPDMPGDVAQKFLAHDKLIFPVDSVNLQNSELISVIIDVTLSKLRTWIEKYGFDERVTQELIHRERGDSYNDNTVQVKHLFYRGKDGRIYSAWYHLNCTDWLKKPKLLWLGKRDVVKPTVDTGFGELHVGVNLTGPVQPTRGEKLYETEYPIELYIFSDTEEEKIIEHRGRGFFDLATQQAQTNIWSGYLNKMIRSSNVYASPKQVNESSGTGAPKLIEAIKLLNGGMYDQPVDFWEFPMPDTTPLMAIQALSTENQQDTNQLAFTVLNRDDARKTKREMDLAVEEQGMVNSIKLTLWSIFQRRIATRAFDIVLNRARQGLLPAFLKLDDEADEEEKQARAYLLDQEYELRAAGDQEVIEKSDTLQKMQQFFPIIQNTPLGPQFLGDMLALSFPEKGAEYARILMEQRPEKAIMASLVQLVNGLMASGVVPPDQQQQIQAILQQAEQVSQAQP